MATIKQIQANRLNSQLSTGPRSAEGKAASSQNALKSGIDSESQIIRGEDPAALDALAAQYLLDHQPQSAAERALVDILIDSEWLLRRLRKTEAHLWEYQLAGIADRHPDEMLGRAFQGTSQSFARLERRRESVQRAYHRTLHDLRQIQDSRAQACPQPDIPAPASSHPSDPPKPPAELPLNHSSQKAKPEIGFVPENPAHCGFPSRETPKLTLERKKEQPQTAPEPGGPGDRHPHLG
jgi:hypothetical protein